MVEIIKELIGSGFQWPDKQSHFAMSRYHYFAGKVVTFKFGRHGILIADDEFYFLAGRDDEFGGLKELIFNGQRIVSIGCMGGKHGQ